MRADQRAEFGPYQIDTAKRGILPEELRSGAATARIFLSSLTLAGGGVIAVEAVKVFSGNNNSIVRAADPECKIRRFVVFGFEFIDHPAKPNRAGLIDPVDFVTGSGVEFGEANLAVLTDPKNPNSKRTEFSGSMVVVGDHAEVKFANLGVASNTKGLNGKDAAEILVSFKEDKVRQAGNPSLPPEKAVVVECGTDGVAWGGRYATADNISKAIKATAIDTVGARTDQLMEETFGKGRKFGLTPKGDNPQENLKILRASIQEAIKHADEVRQKEKDLAKPVPTAPATGVVTSTLIITGTRPISPTTEITGTRTAASPTLTETVKALIASGALSETLRSLMPVADSGPSNAPAADGSIPVLSGAWEFTKLVFDLPAKGVDWFTEPDTQNPVRGVINVAGLLLALGLLTNHPRRFTERVWSGTAFPVREVRFRRALGAYTRGVAAGIIPAGTPAPARTYPRPFRVL